MKTILLFTWFYLPFIGGAELFVKAITDRLAGRFRFVIVTARAKRELSKREENGDVLLIRTGIGHGVDKFVYPLPAVMHSLLLPRVDLVHAIMVNASAVAAYGFSRVRRVPTLLTLQEGDTEDYAREYLGPFFRIYPWLHRPFDRIHAISRYLEQQAIGYGADPSAIRVVPNGVDTERFSPDVANGPRLDALRKELSITDERVLVSVSRLVPKNGLDIVIDALPRILEVGPRSVVVFVGDGPERRALERRAEENGVRQAVRFVGTVDHELTADYLRLADVFVRPSRSEGLGSAFLEAMACGIPVVATPVGGIPDFLRHEDNGLFVAPESAPSLAEGVLRLLSDGELSKRFAEEGVRIVRSRYRWDVVAGQIGEIYQELLDR